VDDVHYKLGGALTASKDIDGAIAAYRRAVKLNPSHALAHYNLGILLDARNRLDDAISAYRQAISVKPDFAPAYNNLGFTLQAKQDLDGAIAAYRRAIYFDPRMTIAYVNLGRALEARQDLRGAISAFRQAIALDPGRDEAHYLLGNALKDLPDLAGAAAAYRRAIALRPDAAEAHCNLGYILTKQARLTEALASFRRGHALGARRPDWPYPSAAWVRQAERLVALEQKLTAFLEGKFLPADNEERLGLADVAYLKKCYACMARLYAEAWAADPQIARESPNEMRLNAACAAALAAAGVGQNAAQLSDQDRARLREQARRWLRAELAVCKKLAPQAPAQVRTALQQMLRNLQMNPALTGLREPVALANLPANECQSWKLFWAEVEKVLKTL
jgi:tetratricopeptide (TPR) repeat protein